MQTILTKYTEFCVLCGRPKQEEHHLINGRGFRQLSEKHGLKIPICDAEHQVITDNPVAEKLSKIIGQLAYEKDRVAKGDTEDEARESFRKEFGRSYL